MIEKTPSKRENMRNPLLLRGTFHCNHRRYSGGYLHDVGGCLHVVGGHLHYDDCRFPDSHYSQTAAAR